MEMTWLAGAAGVPSAAPLFSILEQALALDCTHNGHGPAEKLARTHRQIAASVGHKS